MRFLVITKNTSPMPVEAVIGLMEAMSNFAAKYRANGKMEQAWAFAGTQGGGAIMNVESCDELDDIMSEYPFAPFSQIDVYPLTDLLRSLTKSKEVAATMMAVTASR